MDDPSGYTCIVHSEKLIRIPDAITTKVPDINAAEASGSSRTTQSLFLNKYIVTVEKTQYLQGITKIYRYSSAPSLSTSRVVQPAECYISPALLDNNAIQKYSSAVVLYSDPDSFMADLEHVCEFIESNIHARVQVKLLNVDAFLLYIDEDYPFMPLHKMLSISMEDWINRGDLRIIQWNPEYGSMGCVIAKMVHLQISGLPCNLNSPRVIEYILGPFALVKSHETTTGDSTRDIGRTITAYKCTLWCATIEVIPVTLQIKMLPLPLTNQTEISTGGSCRCPILDVSIQATAFTSGDLFV